MKTTLLKCISAVLFLTFVIACSTKRNTFVSRNMHALSARDNILYNGGLALDKGIEDLKLQYRDNFWTQLPIERMQLKQGAVMPGDKEEINPNFERAETKATKAIQKHSMNINGSEKNPQMDEAHLMLGKARYYDQRFVPALEAFNYILYKYPTSDKIYEAKVWREKTNMRLENDQVAVDNLTKLLKEFKFKDQIYADANAALSQAYLNLEQPDSAVSKLKIARDYTKENEERARYYFILGQLYETLGYKDSAFASFQSVIDMHRKAPRQYVIHAHMRQAEQFDYKSGDTVVFLEKYAKLLKDRENRPYLDALNHQMALFYDRQKNDTQAKKYYNLSLKNRTDDQYMMASNYRNLATIHFDNAQYVTAGKYYDSTLVQLEPRSREFKSIQKKRLNLNDVIKYEAIATRNDSILKVYAMSDTEKLAYYNAYIDELKKERELQRIQAEKAAANGDYGSTGTEGMIDGPDGKMQKTKPSAAETAAYAQKAAPVNGVVDNPSSAGGGSSTFYFYNPATVAYGKNEFRKIWGNRALRNNWRVSAQKGANANPDEDQLTGEDGSDVAIKDAKSDEMLTPEYYISQLPTTQIAIDSIGKERNFAYFQLGVIYKEKFKEYALAADKLEKLLDSQPEERLILPAMYNLYKIYEIIDKGRAAAMKSRIIADYPDSRYAQILENPDPNDLQALDSPQEAYNKLYTRFNGGDYKKTVLDAELAIEQYTGDPIVPKIEMLKANAIGKIKGLEAYKAGLNYVALTYPNSDEGKKAESMLAREIVWMEALQFNSKEPLSWKILYRADNLSDNKTIALYGKLAKFIKERQFDKIKMSVDLYTMDQNFIVIHGLKTEEHAKGIVSILKEFKDYKIKETPYIISNENYKVVQIKKNFDEFLLVGNGPIVPVDTPNLPEDTTDKKSDAEIQLEQMQQRAKENQRMKTSKDDTKTPVGNAKPQSPQMQGNDPKQKQNQNQNQLPTQMQPPGMMMPPQPPRDGKPK